MNQTINAHQVPWLASLSRYVTDYVHAPVCHSATIITTTTTIYTPAAIAAAIASLVRSPCFIFMLPGQYHQILSAITHTVGI